MRQQTSDERQVIEIHPIQSPSQSVELISFELLFFRLI